MEADFLLIGGGFASAFNADTLRKEGAEGKIIILSAENNLPYLRPQLPKAFLLGKLKPEQLPLFNESYYQKNDIDILLGTKALAVDSAKKLVKTDQAGDIFFNQLLIATGCSPKKLDVPGSHLVGIHYLKTVNDAKAIILEMVEAKDVIILGGGFVGIELASSLIQKNINVTIITQEFTLFHASPSAEITTFLENHRVRVHLHETIKKFNGKKHVQSVETSNGKNLACDFVIVAAGYLPDTDFLHNSGIKVDDGIIVNQYLQTNQADIYAAGDVANFFDPVFGRFHRSGGVDNAIKQGKISALNMLGWKKSYNSATYFYFQAFDHSFVAIGDTTDAKEKVLRGSVKEKNFTLLYLKDGLLQGAFFCGRPIAEIKAAESLITNHVDLTPYQKQIPDIEFSLEPIATQRVLTLQGGGALGAFECGVVKAMEEYGIYPDIVGGISIGAFNAAIIAGNPKNATSALEAFWNELSLDVFDFGHEPLRRLLSVWHAMVYGSPNFFHPRWLMPIHYFDQIPFNWTSFYDLSAIKDLLSRYIDFTKLKASPIRLLVMAVNIETSEFETFDSYTDDITPDHILASGSLPPGFPWTTINNKHYWDGGIVTNTPLDSVLEICGATNKKIYTVELYPRKRALPKSMIEVMTRKDEILFAEKLRKELHTKDLINTYKKLIEVILRFCEPEVAEEIMQLPAYIQTMGDPGVQSITRIIRDIETDAPYSWDSDFSRETITAHKTKGYETAKKILAKEAITLCSDSSRK